MTHGQALRRRGFFEGTLGIALAKHWALCFLGLATLVFSVAGPGFFDIANFQNIVHLATTSFLLAAAETLVIITGGIDVSIGYVYGLSSVTAAKVMQVAAGLGPGGAIVAGVLVGMAVSLIPGLINGILVTRFKVPSFIATMGMWGICNGVTLFISDGFMPVMGPPDLVSKMGNGFILYIDPGKAISLFAKPAYVPEREVRHLLRLIPNSLLLTLVVLAILGFILSRTKFGRHIYAIGGNPEAAMRAGIDVNAHLVAVYVIAAAVSGIAGVFDVFQTGIGNYTASGAMYELFAVAAVVIGGASLLGGKGRIAGTAVGVLLLAVLNTGLQIVGLPPFYRYIGVGVLLTIAVVVDQLFPDLY